MALYFYEWLFALRLWRKLGLAACLLALTIAGAAVLGGGGLYIAALHKQYVPSGVTAQRPHFSLALQSQTGAILNFSAFQLQKLANAHPELKWEKIGLSSFPVRIGEAQQEHVRVGFISESALAKWRIPIRNDTQEARDPSWPTGTALLSFQLCQQIGKTTKHVTILERRFAVSGCLAADFRGFDDWHPDIWIAVETLPGLLRLQSLQYASAFPAEVRERLADLSAPLQFAYRVIGDMPEGMDSEALSLRLRTGNWWLQPEQYAGDLRAKIHQDAAQPMLLPGILFSPARHHLWQRLSLLIGILGSVLAAMAAVQLAALLGARQLQRSTEWQLRITLGVQPRQLRWLRLLDVLTMAIFSGLCLLVLLYVVSHSDIIATVVMGQPDMPLPFLPLLTFSALFLLLLLLLALLLPTPRPSARTQAGGLLGLDTFSQRTRIALSTLTLLLGVTLCSIAALSAVELAALRNVEWGGSTAQLRWLTLPKINARVAGKLAEALREEGYRVAAISPPPLHATTMRHEFRLQGSTHSSLELAVIQADATLPPLLGLTLIAGRWMTPARLSECVVSETLAKRWSVQGRLPIGFRAKSDNPLLGDCEIVGVIGDVRYDDVRQAYAYALYQLPNGSLFPGHLVYAGEVVSLTAAVQRLLPTFSNVPSADWRPQLQSLQNTIEEQTRSEQYLAGNALLAAAVAALLLLVGLQVDAGLTRLTLQRDAAMRVALGAARRQLLWYVLRGKLGTACVATTAALLPVLIWRFQHSPQPLDRTEWQCLLSLTAGVVFLSALSALPLYHTVRRESLSQLLRNE